ncbi:MAG: porin [Planctomycetaceae bacterium]|jgi:hypothetical protein|nr:porin [Planctomycetaceae bacterium]
MFYKWKSTQGVLIAVMTFFTSPLVAQQGAAQNPISEYIQPEYERISYKVREVARRATAAKDGPWLRLSGWMDQGYAWSSLRPASGKNTPVGLNDQHEQYQLNQLYLILQTKEIEDDDESWSIVGRADLLYGTDHGYVTSRGLEDNVDGTLHLNDAPGPGDDFRGSPALARPYYGLAIPQAYFDLRTPIINGMNIRMGHFYTNLGSESIMATENFFYTLSMSKIYGRPQTHTGIVATTSILDDAIGFTAGVTRGWDNWEDDAENELSVMAGLSFEFEDTSVALNVHTGPDHLGIDNFGNPTVNEVTIVTMTLARQLTDNTRWVLDADLAHGDAMAANSTNGGLSGARWYGLTNYLIHDFGPKVSMGMRVEWFRDQDNARILPGALSNQVSGGNYVNVTMGANYRHSDRWTFRPEARWDWSDTKSNDLSLPGVFGDFSENDQFTLSLDAIFTY